MSSSNSVSGMIMRHDCSVCFAYEGQEVKFGSANMDLGQFSISQLDLVVSHFFTEGNMYEEREESRKGFCKAFDAVSQHSCLEVEEVCPG